MVTLDAEMGYQAKVSRKDLHLGSITIHAMMSENPRLSATSELFALELVDVAFDAELVRPRFQPPYLISPVLFTLVAIHFIQFVPLINGVMSKLLHVLAAQRAAFVHRTFPGAYSKASRCVNMLSTNSAGSLPHAL